MPPPGRLGRVRDECARGGTDYGERAGQGDRAVVLGLPRGGIVTAYYVATELGLPLDVAIARKIGCPFHEELALGASRSSICRVPIVRC